MATLTSTQAAQVRMYLGYPDLFRYENTRLEGILQSDQLSVDALKIVSDHLAQLAGIDALLGGSGLVVGQAAQTAGIQKADEVTLYQGQTIKDLRKLGRQAASRISNLLGVPFYGDPYGESGYPGDAYSAGLGGSPGSADNTIPLG